MHRLHGKGIFLAVILMLVHGFFINAAADHDDHKKHKRHHEKAEKRDTDDDYGKDVAVGSPTYIENCGSCHFAYPPGLLPSGSWNKILNEIDNHFGETVTIDPDSAKTISEYLNKNAADRSSAKLSAKIMKGVKGQAPNRITELPYIIKEHHELAPSVFNRPAIGSLSNCAACHTGAAKGIFDDDRVVIPK